MIQNYNIKNISFHKIHVKLNRGVLLQILAKFVFFVNFPQIIRQIWNFSSKKDN